MGKRYKAFSPPVVQMVVKEYNSSIGLTKGRLIVSLLEQGHLFSLLAGKSLEDLRTLVIDEKIYSFQSNQLLTTVGIKKLLAHLSNFDLDLDFV